MSEQENFLIVLDSMTLLPILNLRIPRSAHVYNMVKLHGSFSTEMTFYTLNGTSSEETCCILGKYMREDTGQQFVFSIPNGLYQLTLQIQNALTNASPEVINWDAQLECIGTDRIVTELISKILLQRGNTHELLPCQFFHFPRDAQMDSSVDPLGFEFRSLNSPPGIQFLLTPRWYWNENTEAFRKKCVERCLSVGAYNDEGLAVSGAIVNPTGHVGVVTLEDHQRKGLSLACLLNLLRIMEKNTELIPCSMVYLKNTASIRLHEKSGHQATHVTDFVIFKGE